MNKIEFRIWKNTIVVDFVNKDIKENLNNTNVINTKKIYFSTKYIEENLELVSSFLHVIILKNEIDTFKIKNKNITLSLLKVLNHLSKINNLILEYDSLLSYSEFLEILNNNYLSYIDLYDIPPYLLERIDTNKNLKINIRNEILFVSNFMTNNNINTYSDIFYKKEIVIDEFNERDYYDFDSFIEINKYLRSIVFKFYNKKLFDYVFKSLIKKNISNVKISFMEEFIKIDEVVPYIGNYKKAYEDFIFENNIKFKIIYSNEYKKNNLIKQLNLNIIKYSLLLIIVVVSSMIVFNLYRDFSDNNKYMDIENDLNKLLSDFENDDNEQGSGDDIIFIEPNGDDYYKITQTTTTTTSIYDIKYDKVFDKLLEINDDTIGWLTVNNTNIDYPVVQYTDNDYYLNRDFYKSKNRHGWIFMDYRNSYSDFSDNTIIYGHNLANQKMFGTLRYASNSSWYKKTSNQIISFNTLNGNYNWQIISVYKVPKTNDYLVANFASVDEKMDFLNMIVGRSIYDFNQSYDENTKILTLSTCSNGTKERFVVHAKLIQ